jgi:hypothetical protein
MANGVWQCDSVDPDNAFNQQSKINSQKSTIENLQSVFSPHAICRLP